MRKSRFSEAQIIGMIKEQEAGMSTAKVCRKHGLSQGTFYKFKSQYGGMEVSDAAKLRAMTDENAKLKRLLADAMLDNVVVKDLLGKNCQRQTSDERQRVAHRGIMISRNAGPAALLVLIPKLSGVIVRLTILRYVSR